MLVPEAVPDATTALVVAGSVSRSSSTNAPDVTPEMLKVGLVLLVMWPSFAPVSLAGSSTGALGAPGFNCCSYAPMSESSYGEMGTVESESIGRVKPRWSVVKPNALPFSRAGLPESKACVFVGPPLAKSAPSLASATPT